MKTIRECVARICIGSAVVALSIGAAVADEEEEGEAQICTFDVVPYYGMLTPGGIPPAQGGSCWIGCSDQVHACVSGTTFRYCDPIDLNTVCFVGTLSQN